jgi:hypothetical protein
VNYQVQQDHSAQERGDEQVPNKASEGSRQIRQGRAEEIVLCLEQHSVEGKETRSDEGEEQQVR